MLAGARPRDADRLTARGREADRSLIVADHMTLPVQVNGRKRAELTIGRDAADAEIEAAALALDAVRRAMDNRPAKKVIIVPQRIVNVVV